MKATINKIFNKFGYEIRNKKYIENLIKNSDQNFKISPTCIERLEHARNIGFLPKVIYDCGAFIGKWAKEANELFPESKIILIEPNNELLDHINDNVKSFRPLVNVIQAAVGENHGSAILNVWENSQHGNKTTALAGSSLLGHVQGEASKKIEVEIKTIDQIVDDTGLKPDLIKLDLQGGEKSALIGAEKILEYTEMVIVEFGVLEAYKSRTTSKDLFDILDPYGFVLYDIVDLRYRPYDGALVGGDFFFIKKDSRLKSHKDYF